MKIAVLSIVYNEATILPHFLKHYSFADTIIIYDNESTDNTAALAAAANCIVIPFASNGENDRVKQTELQNTFATVYADYDWLIVVDADELIDVNRATLEQFSSEGVTFIITKGFEMFSEIIPENISNIKTGVFYPIYSKPACFNPTVITKTNYVRGRHCWKPVGNAVKNTTEIVLKHYKYVGDIENIVLKHKQYIERTKQCSSANHTYNEEFTRKRYAFLKEIATEL